jgi:hypothetical protein
MAILIFGNHPSFAMHWWVLVHCGYGGVGQCFQINTYQFHLMWAFTFRTFHSSGITLLKAMVFIGLEFYGVYLPFF